MGVECKPVRKYDAAKARHYINGWNAVFHCHHHAALYTQLAEDAGELFDGHVLLAESARDIFFQILNKTIEESGASTQADRIPIIESVWSTSGMGKLKIVEVSSTGGKAEMVFSHIDSGWAKKWGTRENPVNFITVGYLSAAFASLFDQNVDSFCATEIQSIISGAEKSVFEIKTKN